MERCDSLARPAGEFAFGKFSAYHAHMASKTIGRKRTNRNANGGNTAGAAACASGAGTGGAVANGRTSADQYYLNIAREVAGRATCLRRKFGAVIVKSKQIVSTGYNGAPRGTANCSDLNQCLRNELGAKPGEHYEWCRSVHGEANAIIHASRFDMIEATLYLVGLDAGTGEIVRQAEPCRMCKRMIINAGISEVVVQSGPGEVTRYRTADWTSNNLGEYELIKGKLTAVRPSGY